MTEPDFPPIETLRRIHFIAIAGVGMASLAGMLRTRGFTVTGSDRDVYPPASTMLERLEIPVLSGFRAENLDPAPDLVVVGNAVSRTNPEVQAVLERGLAYASMPETLRRLLLPGKRSLVVAGTHGKSTSTAMLGWVLERAGRDPSLMVGGESIDFGGNFRLGGGDDFVIEGDEYDTAFFDKGPKFLHYEPRGLILTSIEFDHADIYRDLDHVTRSFVDLLRIVPSGSPIVACPDFARVERALNRGGRPAERFGFSQAADWRPAEVRDDGGRTRFEVRFHGRLEAEIALRAMGEMNVRNALGVFALARGLGLAAADIVPALDEFRGVRRRQEILADGAVTVIDDFAHHPTAIAATLDAVRRRHPGRRLWAVFEPRSNTSRRRVFQEEFPRALAVADRILLAEPYVKPTDPLPEAERLSAAAVVEDITRRGRTAAAFADPGDIFAELRREVVPGDVVVFLSNGAFGGLPRRFAEAAGGVTR
ncbi:MAG: UDP-N-acetylmuramate: L-alanyl-gamma-D-glutamyl-meso-diaminopimelate ligase [Candidatus Binatota bacterium]|nr:UDP-N-acetylmuramate: L-alanyl-gamma-D-glutamyl-meso-diaminopimelate ligase [Candidatus Binatota bacterium]